MQLVRINYYKTLRQFHLNGQRIDIRSDILLSALEDYRTMTLWQRIRYFHIPTRFNDLANYLTVVGIVAMGEFVPQNRWGNDWKAYTQMASLLLIPYNTYMIREQEHIFGERLKEPYHFPVSGLPAEILVRQKTLCPNFTGQHVAQLRTALEELKERNKKNTLVLAKYLTQLTGRKDIYHVQNCADEKSVVEYQPTSRLNVT